MNGDEKWGQMGTRKFEPLLSESPRLVEIKW